MIMEKAYDRYRSLMASASPGVPDIAARGRLGNGFNDHVNTSEYV